MWLTHHVHLPWFLFLVIPKYIKIDINTISIVIPVTIAPLKLIEIYIYGIILFMFEQVYRACIDNPIYLPIVKMCKFITKKYEALKLNIE